LLVWGKALATGGECEKTGRNASLFGPCGSFGHLEEKKEWSGMTISAWVKTPLRPTYQKTNFLRFSNTN